MNGHGQVGRMAGALAHHLSSFNLRFWTLVTQIPPAARARHTSHPGYVQPRLCREQLDRNFPGLIGAQKCPLAPSQKWSWLLVVRWVESDSLCRPPDQRRKKAEGLTQLRRCEEFADMGCKVYATARKYEAMDGFSHEKIERVHRESRTKLRY
jgi:hypothetical protein